MNKFLILSFCIIVTVSSCKKSANTLPNTTDSDTTATTPAHGLDTYIVGTVYATKNNPVGCYWKNGIFHQLNDTSEVSFSNSLTISGSDVYICGSSVPKKGGYAVATYWKNGEAHLLPDNGNSSGSNAVYVNGTDVYISGYVMAANGSQSIAVYWKNGVRHDYTTPSGDLAALVIKGNIIYGFGFTGNQLGFWENNTFTNLTPNTNYSEAGDLYLNGDDIYLAGTVRQNLKWNIATIWKNGIATQLEPDTTNSYANSILINGNDVYVAGSITNQNGFIKAYYWKNGASKKIEDSAGATSMTFNGTDMYVVGYKKSTSNIYSAAYWLNGNKIALSNPYPSATFSAAYQIGFLKY